MTAATSLACAFPPRHGQRGAATTILDIDHGRHAGAHPLFIRSKREAVRMIVARNMEWGNAYGHGNRAAKRQARAEAVQLESVLPVGLPLRPAEVDKLAERYSEGRRHEDSDRMLAKNIHE